MNNRRSPQIFQARALGDISPIDGLDFILSLFQEPIWPRTISTKITEDRQLTVSSREEALERFAGANWLDCRISAYSPDVTINPSAIERFQGFTRITPRRLIVMIDLDSSRFRSERALQLALTRTLQNINSILGADPTAVLWSGNGYHVYSALDSEGIILENIRDFSGFDQISVRFLRFAEFFLSGGKSDKAHNTTVSFRNCMLRIPGSFNSKLKSKSKNSQVQVVRDSKSTPATPATFPSIKPLLRDFRRCLIDQQIRERYQRQIRSQKQLQRQRRYIISTSIAITLISTPSISINSSSTNYIKWIEKLLQTPLSDFRKYCIWRILTPYLLNVKKLPEQEVVDTVKEWLGRCDELRKLDFRVSVNRRVRDGLEGAAEKGYFPISLEKLKLENPQLYDAIMMTTT